MSPSTSTQKLGEKVKKGGTPSFKGRSRNGSMRGGKKRTGLVWRPGRTTPGLMPTRPDMEKRQKGHGGGTEGGPSAVGSQAGVKKKKKKEDKDPTWQIEEKNHRDRPSADYEKRDDEKRREIKG